VARGLGIRFAAEAGFLVAVAVVDVVVGFHWPVIVVTMGVAWGLVSALEWWLARPRAEGAPAPAAAPPRRHEAPAPKAEADLPQHVRVIEPGPPPVAVEPEPVLALAEPEPEPEPEPAPRVLEAVPPPPPEPPPPPPPEPMPEPKPPRVPEVVSLASRDTRPREWNLWELERLAREHGGEDRERDEERNYLLMYLREFANADGALPLEFDPLVRDAFGDLLAETAIR
jgi:hypothetical protein